MAQTCSVLKPAEVAELLTTLHAAGYRLRKLGPDTLEVDEIGPKLQFEAPAQREQQPPAEEDSAWDHVGGRPNWVRKPAAKTEKSPWADDPRDS